MTSVSGSLYINLPAYQNFHSRISAFAKNQLITDLAKNCLAEIACTAILTGLTCLFVGSAGIGVLLIGSLVILSISIISKVAIAILQYRDPDSEVAQKLKWLGPIGFSFLSETTAAVLIHEGGHAMAASLLFKSANPRITVMPFAGGATSFSPDVLSKLGRMVGPQAATGLVSLAGPLLAVSVATVIFALGYQNREEYPELSKYALAASGSCLINHSIYALSALWVPIKNLSHDFVMLGSLGIHPVVAAVSIVALPIIALSISSYCQMSNIELPFHI